MKDIIENLLAMSNMAAEKNLNSWKESFSKMLDSAEQNDYEGYERYFEQSLDYERKYLESIKERQKYLELANGLG